MNNNQILYQIKDLEKNILRKVNIQIKINKKEFPKSLTQIQIINYIVENKNKDVYQKDFEEKLNLRRATISGVLKTMEKNNLIERTSNVLDARSKKIKLNKKVKDKISYDCKKISEIEEILTKDISEEELKLFQNVINKMKYNIINN